ncbi:MAG: peptidoglycan bridge formation glycyltransferase FemA/FemB family protein [Candidatus Moraniibacteriota bacterium]
MNQETAFLQSEHWLVFQEAVGKDTVRFSGDGFSANGIIHELPIVGAYLYVPRGPIISQQLTENKKRFVGKIQALAGLAKEKRAKWVRIEPETEELLERIRQAVPYKVVKAPHDTQPREVFVVDISRSEEELLAAMKPKTRYNIRLAEKKGVRVFETREGKYEQAFLDLMRRTADRKEITPHPRGYYETFLTAFPESVCQLFVAEYDGQVLAANLLMVSGTTATYLHGGSSGEHRETMAPYLLQWEQMRYAKAHECLRYDFGGIRTTAESSKLQAPSSWDGITRFKVGFSPETQPMVFPGAYDIILDAKAYFLYERLRSLQESLRYIKKFLSR